MLKKELAAQLGISGAMVTKLSKRGMPTDDVEKARRWRRRHLELPRTKGVRFDPDHVEPQSVRRTPTKIGPANASTLAEVTLFVDLAERELETGKSPELALSLLRDAMRRLPAEQRPSLEMPVEIWMALVPKDVIEVLQAEQAAIDARDVAGDAHAREPIDEKMVDGFWFEAAIGNIYVSKQPPTG